MHLRKIQLFLVLLLFGIHSVNAQTRNILGRVVDQKGDAVSNASVTIKGSNAGTTTDEQGQFSIAAEPTTTLVISSIGFATTQISSSVNNPLIHLVSSDKAMDEVVVVAYGTQKKSEITSAITTVSAATIKNQQIVSVGQALQGTASGVLVVNTNGQPGENPTIRIRGVASLLASADPLVVVDGIIFQGNLNMINPADIESFSILKDATAGSLYGSRAGNGVILITTKSGRKGGAPVITLSGVYGVSSRAVSDYDYLNTQQHFELGWEGLKNTLAGTANPEQTATNTLIKSAFHYNPYGPSFANPVGIDGKLVAGAVPLWNDNWTKALTRSDAARRDVNLGISGGSEKSKYYFSAGYINQDAYIAKSNYERISTRFNYTTDLKDWLTVGARVSISSSKQNYPAQGDNTYSDVIQYGRTLSSVYPIYAHDDNGDVIKDGKGHPVFDFGKPDPSRTVNINRPILQLSNVVATLSLDDWTYKRLLTDLNTFAQINFTKNLYFKSSFGINRNAEDQLHYQNKDYGDAQSVQGRVQRENLLTTSWTWNNMINYDKRFGDHHFEAMASYESYKYFYETFTGSKTGFPFAGQEQPTNAATIEDLTGYTVTSTLTSYLGRFKYDYKGKYFAEITARNDASSIFAPDYRKGWFPAAGVSWIMSEEDFMKRSSAVSLLKVRVSYGELGNNALKNYFPYLSTFGTGFNQLTDPGVYLNNIGNSRIKWERQLTTNIGIDFGFFQNRLSGSVDLFDKSSKNLLYRQPLTPSIGFSSYQTNIGKVQNRGVELNLDYAVLQSRNFNLNLLFNFTYIKNKVIELAPGIDTAASKGAFRDVVGKSLFSFYLPLWAGVDPATGVGQWYKNEKDANGNLTGKKVKTDVLTDALSSEEWVGSGLPKYTGGFTARLRAYNFDMNILFNYAFGGKYYDGNYAGLMSGLYNGYGSQMDVDQLKRWRKAGDITDVPALDPNNPDYVQNSTRFLFSGDYVRLRNITLGYTINPGNVQKVFKSIRVYLLADNLFTWDKLKKGSDPESALNGDANGNAFPFKTFSGGIDLTF
jgi:TonB-linked SusC/RagA family outer membrane protein